MSEIRRPSIVDKVTPKQVEAWNLEHYSIGLPQDARQHYLGIAHYIRGQDLHEKIESLNERSDEQNKIIDIGLEMAREGHEVPIFELTK